MQKFEINRDRFPELKGNNLERFISFMTDEFPEYIEENKLLKAHNEGDSHWFTQQYIDGKNGKGIYQDWFKKRTIDRIITNVSSKYGAPMGRGNTGNRKDAIAAGKKIFDCAVPMDNQGCYDKGGAYWGMGKQLRVSYTKDLSYVEFYRVGDIPQ